MAAARDRVWLVAVLLVPCVCSQATPRPVYTSAGLVSGKMSTVQVRNRPVQMETFWGIPYAKPPTGDHRFKKPYPVEPWTGIRNAWDPPKACMQKVDNDLITSPDQMSEDCLYLNIWRPHCNQDIMTTMVWVHGGSLKSGSSADPRYNGEKLASSQCVIVASMNYRLGVFGFLYTRDPDKTGNAGLFDVLSALQFLHSNIEVFGGNKSSITLFGSGAGAYIVSTFLMSTLGRDLFSNAILQSGSPLMDKMYQSHYSASDATKELAKHADCTSSATADLVCCLRMVKAKVLVDAFHKTTSSMKFRMVSVNDGEFLTQDPSEYLRHASTKNCSLLLGTNKDEATEAVSKLLPVKFNSLSEEPLVLNDLEVELTLNEFLAMLYKSPYVEHIASALKLMYGYNKLKKRGKNTRLRFLSNVCLDHSYRCPQKALIDTYTKLGSQVYVYSFNRAPNITDLPAWVGATHGSEIRYIFRSAPGNESEIFVDAEIALSRHMMKMWANFAKTGNPTPGGDKMPRWKAYKPGHNINVFTEKATIHAGKDEHHECLYWNTFPALMAKDFVN